MPSASENVTRNRYHISDKLKWDKLKPVSIPGLKLLNSNKEDILEKKLLVELFPPIAARLLWRL